MIAAISFLFAAATSGWHDARTIVVPPVAKLPAYVRLQLPQTIDGGPNGAYPDVRVVDADGREVPYALDIDPKASPGVEAQLSDVGFVPGQFTQAIADGGDSGALHSAIAIETTQRTFFERVQIATSDDRRTWTVVVPNALIYQVEETDRGIGQVAYGPSRARWVRIRVMNGSRQFTITGAIFPASVVPPRFVPLSNTQSVKQSGTNTIVAVDFATPNTNLAALTVETSTPQYYREFTLERPGSGESGWEQFSNSTMGKLRGQRVNGTGSFTMSAGDQHVRTFRVVVQNGDDPPLAELRVTPLGHPHHIIFQATPGAQYRLLWGNADAVAPNYDLGDILQREAWTVAATAALGAVASTTFAASSGAGTPWLQQAALPIALALLFVVLLVVALVAMRAKPAD